MITRVLAAAYFCFLLVIICLANTGRLGPYVSAYRELPWGDTLGHFILMGTLAFFANLVLGARTVRLFQYEVLVGSLLVMVFVFLEECSQWFLPHRTFSLLDLFADALGILFFGYLAQRTAQDQSEAH